MRACVCVCVCVCVYVGVGVGVGVYEILLKYVNNINIAVSIQSVQNDWTFGKLY